jgi:DNA repair exonuclease SbcCD nuclease subunit
MKIAILGDTHFGMRNDSLDFHKYYEKFYTETFFPHLLKNDIKTVVQLGDLFDRRKYINFNSLHLARKYFFDKLKEYDIKLITLLGNHDIAFKNTLEVNSSELLLGEYGNVTVHNSFDTVDFDGINVDIIPWLCDSNEAEIFDKVKQSRSEICFGHFEISGFEMERGVICHEGLDRTLLSKYDMVLTGHFHHRSSDGHIYYVGTPGEITWSDYDDMRGFHIFDLNTRELEFFRNPHRIFRKINYNDSLENIAEQFRTFDYSVYKDCYVKVIVVDKINPFLFDFVIYEKSLYS